MTRPLPHPSSALLPLLLLLLVVLLAAFPAVSGCAWRTCHTVTVDYLPAPASAPAFADANGGRSVVLHRCQPSNNFPEKCHLSEFVSDPDGLRNFTMRKAQLVAAPLDDLCQFRLLAGLDLAENAIADFAHPDLPSGCLIRLRWLSLRGNALRDADLAQFMRLLPALEKLDLSENSQLESLHLSQLPQPDAALKVVLAAKCRLKQVDISLVRLPSLQDLDLSYNQVSRVTNRLHWRWTLRDAREIQEERNRRRARDPDYYARLSVLLVQNQIGPEAFGHAALWGLPVPDLATQADEVVNQLKRYRDAFQSFLYIDNFGSTIACDCHLLHAWNYLRKVHRDPDQFSKRNAISLDYWLRLTCDSAPVGGGGGRSRLAKRTLTSLTAADLTCDSPDGCPPSCACLERAAPSELLVDCRDAGLQAMPHRLPSSVHPVRYVLLLSGNRIRTLTAPPNADRVQELDLSRNLITEAADFAPLAAFSHLHSLNLTDNPMSRVPRGLLRLARPGAAPPSVRLAGSFRCDCALLEPSAWEQLRRLLHRDDLRDLRCMDGELSLRPEDFRQLRCVSRQFNTTSIVYRERHVFGQPVLLWLGVGSAALFLLALVAVVLVVLRYRVGASGCLDHAGKPLSRPLEQPTPVEPGDVGAFGCGCPPDWQPPATACSPYDNPRYVPSRPGDAAWPRSGPDGQRQKATTVVFLRDSDCVTGICDPIGGLGLGVRKEFRARIRSRSLSGGEAGSSGSCSGGGEAGSDPAVSVGSCQRRGRSRRRCPQPSRLMLERELLLPPPLPPRGRHQALPTHPAQAALVTDV